MDGSYFGACMMELWYMNFLQTTMVELALLLLMVRLRFCTQQTAKDM